MCLKIEHACGNVNVGMQTHTRQDRRVPTSFKLCHFIIQSACRVILLNISRCHIPHIEMMLQPKIDRQQIRQKTETFFSLESEILSNSVLICVYMIENDIS